VRTTQPSITLPDDMADAVNAKVRTREYATESGIIRDRLHVLLRVIEPSKTRCISRQARPRMRSQQPPPAPSLLIRCMPALLPNTSASSWTTNAPPRVLTVPR